MFPPLSFYLINHEFFSQVRYQWEQVLLQKWSPNRINYRKSVLLHGVVTRLETQRNWSVHNECKNGVWCNKTASQNGFPGLHYPTLTTANEAFKTHTFCVLLMTISWHQNFFSLKRFVRAELPNVKIKNLCQGWLQQKLWKRSLERFVVALCQRPSQSRASLWRSYLPAKFKLNPKTTYLKQSRLKKKCLCNCVETKEQSS